jgi:hypothetical protein
LDPGHSKNLVGLRPDKLGSSRSIRPGRQPFESIRDVDIGMAVHVIDEKSEDGVLGKFSGLSGEEDSFAVLIRLQPVDEALEKVRQHDTGASCSLTVKAQPFMFILAICEEMRSAMSTMFCNQMPYRSAWSLSLASHYCRMLLTRHYNQRPFDETVCDALIANGGVKKP